MFSRSILFITIIFFLSFSFSNNSFSSAVIFSLLFKINITKSASFIIVRLFSIPIFSTTSSDSLIPAVSIIFKITLSNIIVPSTMSLVVPGTFVTIAFSSSNSEFRRLLFPTFGLPMIPTFIPSLITLLSWDFFIIFSNFSLNFCISGNIFSLVRTSISSYSG